MTSSHLDCRGKYASCGDLGIGNTCSISAGISTLETSRISIHTYIQIHANTHNGTCLRNKCVTTVYEYMYEEEEEEEEFSRFFFHVYIRSLGILVSVCLSVCPYICVSFLSLYLSLSISLYLSVCLCVSCFFEFLPSLSPSQFLSPCLLSITIFSNIYAFPPWNNARGNATEFCRVAWYESSLSMNTCLIN